MTSRRDLLQLFLGAPLALAACKRSGSTPRIEGELVDGAFARGVRIGQIPHPSPASPAANRGWTEAVDAKLATLGLAPPGAAPLR